MSGLAAAIDFDGGPSLSALYSLLIAAAHRGPDGTAVWSDEHTALGLLRHLLFDGSPAQPVARAHLALVFDGRLDNRDDLLRRLGVSPGTDASDDATLALAAFLRWGDEAVAALEGDFAFVLWNSADRRVLAGRDCLGVRPIHWSVSGPRLLIASDVAQLTAAAGIPRPDESAVADLLAGEPPADERTLFHGIQRIPPGHVLVGDGSGCRLRRYWAPDPAPSLAVRTDDDWAAECRELVERAVRVRMRSHRRVAVFFSGGVDSSVVLTLAHRIAAEHGADRPVPVSLLFDEPESDESVYRREVARQIGVEPVSVRPAVADGNAWRAQADRRLTLPDLPADLAGRSLRDAAKQAGASIALTGLGPDLLFSGSTASYADLLARGRVFSALDRFRLDRTTEYSGWRAAGLLTSGLWPLLPAGCRRLLRAPARSVAREGIERRWLRLRPTRRDAVPDPPRGVPHAAWDILWTFADGWTTYFLETAERTASEAQFEDRHPLMDASIVRFALSLPEDQRRRGRITKFVLRRAVPELAPAVATRTSKGTFGHLMTGALAAVGGRRFFQTLAIGEAGWVDAAALTRRYDRLSRASDERAGRDMPILWMVAATELWYRAAYLGSRQLQGAMAV